MSYTPLRHHAGMPELLKAVLIPKFECLEARFYVNGLKTETTLTEMLQECLELLKAMLTPNPAERITLDGIMQHPWCAL